MRTLSSSLASLVVLAVLTAPSGVFAGETCCAERLASTQAKISALVERWESQLAKFASVPAEKRAAVAQEIDSAAKSCPVGSRMGKTLAYVRGSLQAAIDAQAACSASCAEKGEAAVSCEKLMAAVNARKQLLTSLAKLASHAAGPAKGECAVAKDGLASASACAGCDCAGACAAEKGTLASTEKKGVCAQSLAASVRGEKCDKAATALLISKIDGLECEKKAAGLVAAVRKAGCEKSASEVLTRAIAESGKACAAEKAKLASTEKKGACAKSLAVSVREEKCDKAATALLISKIDGLECEKKAAGLVAAVRKAGCEKSASEVLTRAIAESSKACAAEKTTTVSLESVRGTMKSLLATGKELRKSWKKAPKEFAALSAEQQQKLVATVESLKERSPLGMIPDSVAALAEGTKLLTEIDAYLLERSKEKAIKKTVSKEALASFRQQAKLIRQVAATLESAHAMMAGTLAAGESKQ